MIHDFDSIDVIDGTQDGNTREAYPSLITSIKEHKLTWATNPSLYGTAWKKGATAELVSQALSNGFTAIDTACQPKHYREDLVGEGIRKALLEHQSLKRSDLYIQTKFTSIMGQDLNNIPYNPKLPISEQVKQSVEVSLKNLDTKVNNSGVDGGLSVTDDAYIDTVVLHSPMRTMQDTMEVWNTLETYVSTRKILNLGVSNCDLFTLMNIYESATIKPAVVQNRFYRDTKYDIGLRQFCFDHDIVYQSFWTLSANPHLLRSEPVRQLAARINISRESALYCLVLGLGNIVILNGTTNIEHMKEDWAAIKSVNSFITSNENAWTTILETFKQIIGQIRS